VEAFFSNLCIVELDFMFLNGPFRVNEKLREMKICIAVEIKYTDLILYDIKNVTLANLQCDT